ncbi:MAG: D-alanyl-D-alanine carboxypeptidase family protein [Candidatus Paceibacterota bacterium]
MKHKIFITVIITLFIIPVLSLESTTSDTSQDKDLIEEAEKLREEATEKDQETEDLARIRELTEKIKYLNWRDQGIEETEDNISAESFLIVNLSRSEGEKPFVLLKKDADKKHPIASITKLMSAVIAEENLDKNKTITLNPKMLSTYGYSPSLFPGAKVTAKDLMKASLIQSTNDASESLTHFMDTGVFITLMNIKAQKLGMQDTSFFDAHGLNTDNKSTTIDLFKLISYMEKEHPKLLETTKEEKFQMPDQYGRYLTFKNLNVFHDIPNFIGGKTGYLPEAKQTYVCVFNIEDEKYAVILLRSEDRKEDLKTAFEWLNSKPD